MGVLAIAGVLIAGATTALLSDEETSTGNTFSTGAIDLTIDNDSYVTNQEGDLVRSPETSWQLDNLTDQLFFSFYDLKPGDRGEDTISLHVNNNDAYACMDFGITGTPENGQDEAEASVDETAGNESGELQNEIYFYFWNDDGDNVYETDETIFAEGYASDLFADDEWTPLADSNVNVFGDEPGTPLAGDSTHYVAKYWCMGEAAPAPVAPGNNTPLEGTGFTCNGAPVGNESQSDGIDIDVGFFTVQSRHNEQFNCADDPQVPEPMNPPQGSKVTITSNDLAQSPEDLSSNPDAWLFYNDTNDTIMTLNQFSADGGVNDIVPGPAFVGAAQMTLDDGTQSPDYDGHVGQPRYNIATYQFSGMALSSITDLKLRLYDAESDSNVPYLNFNVDFDGSDTWQHRLIFVPPSLPVGSWAVADAIAGGNALWHTSNANWPAGNVSNGSIPGSTNRTWSDILADYPSIRIRVTDSWFGVRVGQPGPIGTTGYVDWIELNGQKYDFE